MEKNRSKDQNDNYILTYTKVHFVPLQPVAEDIHIEDIAHALSYLCRANGHFPAFHSVAQHCIECCEEALAEGLSSRIALACLLHDASEAYLSDITRPVKKDLPRYRDIETVLLNMIMDKYLGGLSPQENKTVKRIDDSLLYYEFYHFMGEELGEKPFIARIPDWKEAPFQAVEARYLELFDKLSWLCRPFQPDKGQVQGVLFDMDGVILDSEKLYCRFWKEAANCLGFPMTWEQALGMRSQNHIAGEAKIKSWFGPDAQLNVIRDKRIELMDAFLEKEPIQLKPGVHELLRYLKEKGIRTAIVTSTPYKKAMQYLTGVGLADQFDRIIGGDLVKVGKPEPEIYLKAAESIGVPAANCFAVEDSPNGLLAAHRAGCMPIMVPDLDEPDPETMRLLYARVNRLDEIIPLVDEKITPAD